MDEITKAKGPVKHFVHFEFKEPNEHHQSDIVFMPNDNGYRYMLTLIDGYSRYAVAVPMKTKTNISNALQAIYDTDKYLKEPKLIVTDSGTEFNKLKYNHKRTQVGDHRGTSIIERFHRTIEIPIIGNQTKDEMKLVKERVQKEEKRRHRLLSDEEFDEVFSQCIVRKWISLLDDEIRKYNTSVNRGTGASPVDIMTGKAKPKEWPPIPKRAQRKVFKVGDVVRIANDKPDRGWRTGDPRFSFLEYVVSYIKDSTNTSPPLYYVVNAKTLNSINKGFYEAELRKVENPTPVNIY